MKPGRSRPPQRTIDDIRQKIYGSGTAEDPIRSTGCLWNVKKDCMLETDLVMQQILTKSVNGPIFGTLDPDDPNKDKNDTHRFKCPLGDVVDSILCEAITDKVQNILHDSGYTNYVLGPSTVIKSVPGGTNQVRPHKFKSFSHFFQSWHRDFPLPEAKPNWQIAPLSVVIPLCGAYHIHLKPEWRDETLRSGYFHTPKLNPGNVLIFLGYLGHRGANFDETVYRLHYYARHRDDPNFTLPKRKRVLDGQEIFAL